MAKARSAGKKKTSPRAVKGRGKRAPATHTASSRRAAQNRAPSRKAAKTTRGRDSRLAATAGLVGHAIGRTVRALVERTPWSHDGMDAIELLEQDHRRLEALLKQGEDTTARAIRRRTALLDTVSAELEVHELIEERVLYPALKPHAEAKEIVLEGYQEHHVADLILKELQAMRKSDERWGAKFKVLKENIEHHIEEEEGEMFRKARSVLGRTELQELGARMAAMKADAVR